MGRPLNLSARDLVFIILFGIIMIWWVRPILTDVSDNFDGHENCQIDFIPTLSDNQRRILSNDFSEVIDVASDAVDISTGVKMVGVNSYLWTAPIDILYASYYRDADLSSISTGVAMAASCYHTGKLLLLLPDFRNQLDLEVRDEHGNFHGRLEDGSWHKGDITLGSRRQWR